MFFLKMITQVTILCIIILNKQHQYTAIVYYTEFIQNYFMLLLPHFRLTLYYICVILYTTLMLYTYDKKEK